MAELWCHLCRSQFRGRELSCPNCCCDLVEEMEENPQEFLMDYTKLPVVNLQDHEFISKVLRYVDGGVFLDKEIVICEQECSICYEMMETAVRLRCGHLFHEGCIDGWVLEHSNCPMCRGVIN